MVKDCPSSGCRVFGFAAVLPWWLAQELSMGQTETTCSSSGDAASSEQLHEKKQKQVLLYLIYSESYKAGGGLHSNISMSHSVKNFTISIKC